jgi:hypothetical protein
MRWAGHVARMGKIKRCIHCFGQITMKGRVHLEDLGVDGRMTESKKYDVWM